MQISRSELRRHWEQISLFTQANQQFKLQSLPSRFLQLRNTAIFTFCAAQFLSAEKENSENLGDSPYYLGSYDWSKHTWRDCCQNCHVSNYRWQVVSPQGRFAWVCFALRKSIRMSIFVVLKTWPYRTSLRSKISSREKFTQNTYQR